MDSKFYSILSLLAYCNPKDFGGNLAISGNAKQKLIGILNEIKKGEYCAEYKDIANNWSVVDVESIPGTGFKAIALGRDLNSDGIYDNVVISYAGTDSLADYGGDDMLKGGEGNDILNGGIGDDFMYGGEGNDIYVVQDEGDQVIEYENEGRDQVNVGILESYTLTDNVEDLLLLEGSGTSIGIGNSLDNIIVGNELSNTLSGLNGNDTLYGGTGNDYLFGGEGNDTYLFSASDQIGIIQDTSGTDSILFDNSVSKDNIAFFMDEENNLYIDYGEAAGQDLIGVVDQANDTIEHIQVGDYSISNTAIEQLIQDMSAYITEQGLVIDSVEDVKANAELMTMINSAWTSAA